MPVDRRLLKGLGVSDARVDQHLSSFRTALPEHDIDTDLRVAHFLSQVLHESGKLRHVRENMNYSAKGLRDVFAKYFPTRSKAERYARKPARIGNLVYGSRMGNGDEASGDGYRYRGRGFIQLTGKDNYREFSAWIGEDVVAKPDLVATTYAVHSAVHFWVKRKINREADADDVKAVTKKVNGGYRGLNERAALLAEAKRLLGLEIPAPSPGRVTHVVTAPSLNLRSEPRVHPSTRIGSLPRGAEVVVLRAAEVPGWVRVRATVNGQVTTGYASKRFLRKT